ncbi:MAG: Uma2 family endonuclease [Fimbriimonadales bacterium]|nr:Uma2 family endonuclease [Fimbriimonadales bacterium]
MATVTAQKTRPVPPRRKRKISEEEFKRLPSEGRKIELVGGEVQEVPTGARHGELALKLSALLYQRRPPHGRLYDSGVGFRMANGNIRSPDVSYMLKSRLPGGQSPPDFAEGAPDLAIEIVSPSERLGDLLSKVADYFESGAQQVWLLFPERQQVVVYRSLFDTVVLNSEDELTGGDLLPDFRILVRELFETD